jgi:DNA-binding NarL/FixJ family response regulator
MQSNPGDSIGVFLVCANPALKEVVVRLLSRTNRYVLAGTVDPRLDGSHIQIYPQHTHFILVDVDIPNMEGLDAIRSLHQAYPTTTIIALTMNDDQDYSEASQASGASWVLVKSHLFDQLVGMMDQDLLVNSI